MSRSPVGGTHARRRRRNGPAGGVLLLLLALLAAACRGAGPSIAPAPALVASLRTEPRSFNRYLARDLTTEVITFLTQSPLVKVDRITQQLVPELAESWQLLPDQITYRVKLRTGVRFSDGEPFSADDVLFSFRAMYAPGSVLINRLSVMGQPLVAQAEDPATVTIRFPTPYGPGLRILDGVPMLPRHRLEASPADGTFRSHWGPATPPSELAGTGPFVLRSYVPGQRLTFDRNPHDWRSAQTRPANRLVLEVMADQDAEAVALQSGRIDFTQSEIRPSDYAALKRDEGEGRVALTDLGVGLDGDMLWFNLTPRAADAKRRWLQQAEFRRAVSHAIDRTAFVNTVFLGAGAPAYSIVSPGNTTWHVATPEAGFDPATTNQILDRLGLVDRDNGSFRHDANGSPATFTLLTQSGNTALERGAAFIRTALQAVGIEVNVVPLEVNALVARFTKGDYDAVYFRLLTTDTDPSLNLDFWLSSGSAHVWNAEQRTPAAEWEKQTDGLIRQMTVTTDQDRRHVLFADVQLIWARELPALCFAFPRVWVAVNTRVRGATPALARPTVLWNSAALAVK